MSFKTTHLTPTYPGENIGSEKLNNVEKDAQVSSGCQAADKWQGSGQPSY